MLWLQKILYLWVKSKAQPESAQIELGLDLDRPICYVLRSRSISDLMVLDYHCQKNSLPRPKRKFWLLTNPGEMARYIYLIRPGLVQLRSPKEAPEQLSTLVSYVSETRKDIQIVPVTIVWGRNPGSEEKSLFKLLSFDHENAGILQRLLTVFFHGRNVICNFGLPISSLNMVEEGASVEQTARKLSRVLRVHFRSQRVAALGPQIYDRNQLIVSLLKVSAVEEAIQEEAHRKKISKEKAEERARRYIDEIAAHLTSQATGALEICLRWILHRIYGGVDIRNGDRVRRYAASHEIVYVPCHRSHMDYLLIGYAIYNLGLMSPHIAAGINLNFWPVGGILRRGGAFFIRRTFKGNRLYSVIFNEYVHYLISKGFSIKFFPEGGRSRTGRLLKPKTGMMNMIVEGYIRNPDRPLVFVPVYVGYDKVLEESSYLRELQGKKKVSESIGQLLGARKILSGQFGRAYVNFGEPIHLGEELNRLHPGWEKSVESGKVLPGSFSHEVGEVAKEVMIRVNNSVMVSSASLVSMALLSSPKRALPETDLINFIQILIDFLRKSPYHEDLIQQGLPAGEQIKAIEGISGLSRFRHPDGDVLFVNETDGIRLTYYRNNILHLYAIPSMIAAFFQHNDQLQKHDLFESCRCLYSFLKEELFVRFNDEEFADYFNSAVESLIELRLLMPGTREGSLRRPQISSLEFSYLILLARAIGSSIDRHAISLALLAKLTDDEIFEREEFERRCQLMSQRIAILNGTNDPDFSDSGLFHTSFDQLRRLNFVSRVEGEKFRVNAESRAQAIHAIGLLSQDLRQSIFRAPVPLS